MVIGASAFFGAPYVPSRRRDVRRMFDTLYPLYTEDVVFDAGSGDGLIVRETSRRGARAIGYEINPIFWALSKILSLGDVRVHVYLRNFWVSDFPNDVTLVYIFSVSRDGRRLLRKLQKERQRLQRPFTAVCYGSPLPGIEPDQVFDAYTLYRF